MAMRMQMSAMAVPLVYKFQLLPENLAAELLQLVIRIGRSGQHVEGQK